MIATLKHKQFINSSFNFLFFFSQKISKSSAHCAQKDNAKQCKKITRCSPISNERSTNESVSYLAQRELNADEVSEGPFINYTLCCTSHIHKGSIRSSKGRF